MLSRFPRDPNKWNAFESQTFTDAAQRTLTLNQFRRLFIEAEEEGKVVELFETKNKHQRRVEIAKFLKEEDPQLFMRIIGRIDSFRSRLDKSAVR